MNQFYSRIKTDTCPSNYKRLQKAISPRARKLFLAIQLTLLAFLPPQNNLVFAADTVFSTSQNVIYDVLPEGEVKVTQNISITNKKTNLRPSEFTFTTGLTDIKNIVAYDSQGPLKLSVNKINDKNNIHVIFNEVVVGEGKTLNWTLSFITAELARNLGRVCEIIMPGVEAGSDTLGYNATLNIPSSLGQPSYVKPPPERKVVSLKSTSLSWTKKQFTGGGAIIGIGSSQTFSFRLRYHLRNPKIYKIKMEIALPPDTTYQTINLKRLSPMPENVTVDEDGNWLASYILSPRQTLEIEASGTADLYSTPQYKERLNDKEKSDYLLTQKYWEKDDEKIKEIANNLKNAKEIYDYVVRTLNYDYSRAENESQRIGARGILDTPEAAICTEFTDLFIALARAKGIKARENDGFAYTTNAKQRPLSLKKDILHAWPEYYDEENETWIMIDPTWEKTTNGIDYFNIFDLNHFTFVKKGKNSFEPYPAGSYKLDESTKDVEVSFGEARDSEKIFPYVKNEFPQSELSGLPIEGQITIENPATYAFKNLQADFSSNQTIQSSVFPLRIAVLPPYARVSIPVKFINGSFTEKKTINYKVSLDQITTSGKEPLARKNGEIQVSPIYTTSNLYALLILAALTTFILLMKQLRRKKV
jgi:hypothetical protein